MAECFVLKEVIQKGLMCYEVMKDYCKRTRMPVIFDLMMALDDSTCFFLFFISWSGFESQTLACSESQLRKRPTVTEALVQKIKKPPSAGSGLSFF